MGNTWFNCQREANREEHEACASEKDSTSCKVFDVWQESGVGGHLLSGGEISCWVLFVCVPQK